MNEVQFRYMPYQKNWRPVHKDSRALRANWSKAFAALKYELARIDAKNVVVEAGYPESRLRNDGWPIANANREHGQVRVSFTREGVPMSFFFGGWTDTEQNVYMIALTLKALRAVDRYGCAQAGEQYRGWSALPPGNAIAAEEWPNVESARRWLAEIACMAAGTHIDGLFRAAAMKAHPDAGGSNELMAKVNRARAYIARG
jgi:hypothetical protein